LQGFPREVKAATGMTDGRAGGCRQHQVTRDLTGYHHVRHQSLPEGSASLPNTHATAGQSSRDPTISYRSRDMSDRLPAETELLWEEFHQTVNMTSDELRTWLLTDASGTDAFAADPSMGLSVLGTRVVELLRKRKVDLTGGDTETMRQVVDYVEDRLADPPAEGAANELWRRSLMTVGHDPLKP
jgi:Protein of unknown function (DUF3140)